MCVCVTFSDVWDMTDYYDVTIAKRDARQLLLTKTECSLLKSVTADGTELIEMPLRYDKYVTSLVPMCIVLHLLCIIESITLVAC